MTELKKTLTYAGVALGLCLIAWFVSPKEITPDSFSDQGEKFFPNFTDPNSATVLEVVDFDEATGHSRPFKVAFANGRWTIPSHNNYPADGKDRLAKTAAGVIDITRDDFRTDLPSEYEACGVIDPLDESIAGPAGRGRRVTIRGITDDILADIIIGKEVPGREGFCFVRVPNEKRVYAARVKVDISTSFADWIESDLLKVDKKGINKILLRDYSIDERTFKVDQRDQIGLNKNESGVWSFDGSGKGKGVDSAKIDQLVTALDELKIVGVRPKPKGLTDVLSGLAPSNQITQEDWVSLQSRGYYLTRDGQLMSNEGELQFWTEAGIHYTLRFGEVAYGSGEAVSAGSPEIEKARAGGADNRYLFMSVDFTKRIAPTPSKPTDMSFLGKPDSLLTAGEKKNKELQKNWQAWYDGPGKDKSLAEDLNTRFAQWYYVISSSMFDKIRLKRSELTKH